MNVKQSLAMQCAFGTMWLLTLSPLWGQQSQDAPSDVPAARGIQKVDFVRDIQPIFERSCLTCHGPDKQKSDYRIDVRDTALRGGEAYAPNIVPGKSHESPLIRFVRGDGELEMPPDGPRLLNTEIELLKAWVDQGAVWPDAVAGKAKDKADLWSLRPLVQPQVPSLNSVDQQVGGPVVIDAFVRVKLAEHNLSPSPRASRRDLIRRVFYDLTGLPPSPEEIDAFVQDPDPQAYEKLVDRLLASPRYGERWARHWMDAAHFAETHGNDQDRIREHAWPYRDYLIEAFNSDKPYTQFVQEQVAGDVLFPGDSSATVALGFLAAGPWDESSLRDIREDTLDRQIARYLDRDDMLATVLNNVCSVTVQCARCHDHKFDPISQADYYSLQAVFSGVERANRRYDADPAVHRRRILLTQFKRDLELRSAETTARLLSDEVQQKVLAWEQTFAQRVGQWRLINLDSFTSSDGATLTQLPDGSILSGGSRPEKDTVTMLSAPLGSILADSPVEPVEGAGDSRSGPMPGEQRQLSRITAVRLQVLTDNSLPRSGPGRQDNGNFHLSEFEVFLDGSKQGIEIASATADFNQSGWDISKSIDKVESTAWGIDPQEGSSHLAVFQFREPIDWGGREADSSAREGRDPEVRGPQPQDRLRIVLKQLHGRAHLIGRMRLCVTDAADPSIADAIPESIAAILRVPRGERSPAMQLELTVFQQLNDVNRALAALPRPSLVYAAAADFEPDGSMHPPPGPRPIHVLHRGDIRQPRQEASPGSLSCVTGVPARFSISPGSPESERRAALARWLTNKDNSLTWRSIVNRVWYHHFGRGIVATLNDFGHMGEAPTHPELLDWLAAHFRDRGQSIKDLHRWILFSQTYQQQVGMAAISATQSESPADVDQRPIVDADNRWLWRMNRTRLDAESIRDSVLAISGRLDLKMGGPSDRQFDLQPGIHVTPKVDYGKFDLSGDLGRRRSIYRFLFRTLPDPFMEALDCPSGDQMTPARSNSVTVQQALSLWNDAFIARHCEYLAQRIEGEKSPAAAAPVVGSLAAQVDRACRLILGRSALPAERQELIEFTQRHGLANLCRLLINSNEFLFLN